MHGAKQSRVQWLRAQCKRDQHFCIVISNRRLEQLLSMHFQHRQVSIRPKINQKSMQNRIWSEKRNFLKNITSPTPEAHFGGSRVQKTFQKSSQNHPKTDQKSNQKFDRFLNGFLIDSSFILAAFWTPFGRQNRLKWCGPN